MLQIYEFFLIPCKRMDENVWIYSYFGKKVEIIWQNEKILYIFLVFLDEFIYFASSNKALA